VEYNLQQLLADTESAAIKFFKGLPIRVWYIKLGEGSWKGIVINTDNKIKLAEGPIKPSPEASLKVLKGQLESIVGKKKTS